MKKVLCFLSAIFIMLQSVCIVAEDYDEDAITYNLYYSEATGKTYAYVVGYRVKELPDMIGDYPVIERWRNYNENGIVYQIVERFEGGRGELFANLMELHEEAIDNNMLKIPSVLMGFPVKRGEYHWDEGADFEVCDLSDFKSSLPMNTVSNPNCKKLILSGELKRIPGDSISGGFRTVELDSEKAEDGEIIIPPGLTAIELLTFAGCTMEKVRLPEGLLSIERWAFQGCKNLKDIEFPDNLSSIGREAFKDCDAFEEIKLPKYLKEIDSMAFLYCDNLKGFITDDSVYLSAEDGVLYDKAKTRLIIYPYGKTDEKFVLPDSVKTIEDCAFDKSPYIKEAYLNNVETIGERAFEQCEKLEKLEFEDGLRCVGIYAFSATAIKELKLPKSVAEIKDAAFSGCKELRRVEIEEGAPVTVGVAAFCNISPIADIFIPDSTVDLPGYAFYYWVRFMHGTAYYPGEFEKVRIFVKPGGNGEAIAARLNEEYGIRYSVLVNVFVNGEKLYLEQMPILEEGRVKIPLRAIGEALGADISWDNESRTAVAKKDGDEVRVTIGEAAIYKNGEKIETDAEAVIEHERTLVPLRAVAEAFGADVNWDNEAKSVLIRYN